MTELLDRLQPDIVVTLEDGPQLMARLRINQWDRERKLLNGYPILSYMPVDGYALPPLWRELTKIVQVVAMTEFGRDEIGAQIPVIPHAVDTDVFRPVSPEHPITTSSGVVLTSKEECRAAFNIPLEAFVIGRADTNSGRKDWPATWRTIERFWTFADRPQTFSVFHTKLRDSGVDLGNLIMKGHGQYAVTGGGDWPVEDLVALINAWDVCLTTTRGEGWGFGPAEALACEIPVVGPRHTSLPEVLGPGAALVEPLQEAYWANPYGVDMKLSDTREMARQLLRLAKSPRIRQTMGEAGRQHIQVSFSWDRSADLFDEQIRATIERWEKPTNAAAAHDVQGVRPDAGVLAV